MALTIATPTPLHCSIGPDSAISPNDSESTSPWRETSKRLQEIHEWEIQFQNNSQELDERDESRASSPGGMLEPEERYEDIEGIDEDEAREYERLGQKLLMEAEEKLKMISWELEKFRPGDMIKLPEIYVDA